MSIFPAPLPVNTFLYIGLPPIQVSPVFTSSVEYVVKFVILLFNSVSTSFIAFSVFSSIFLRFALDNGVCPLYCSGSTS